MSAETIHIQFRGLCETIIAKGGYSPLPRTPKFDHNGGWLKILLHDRPATSSILNVEKAIDADRLAGWLNKRAKIYCCIMGVAVYSNVTGTHSSKGNYWMFGILGKIRFVIYIEGDKIKCAVTYYDEASRLEADKFIQTIPADIAKTEGNFNIVCYNGCNFYTEPTRVKALREFDFGFYPPDFQQSHEKMEGWLKSPDTGLSLLYGAPGQGKTHYLRHLISQHGNCVYMPPHLVNQASSPNFIPFLMGLPPSIFIIEDAEELVTASQSRNAGLQNLLNASDGLLSESIRGKFLLTFNTEIRNVDKALLRGGRNVINYEFKPLDAARADAALIKLGKEPRGKSLSIGEIFNDTPEKSQELSGARPQIGFAALKA